VLKFVRYVDKKRALISRLLARFACSVALGMPYEEVIIKRTKGKKPFLSNPPPDRRHRNWNFNCSHEGDLVVLAAEPTCVCGVDVAAPQQVANRQTVVDLCSHDVGVFTNAELKLLHALSQDEKEQLFRSINANLTPI